MQYRMDDSVFAAHALAGGASRRLSDYHTPPPGHGYMVALGDPYREQVMSIHKFNEDRVRLHAQQLQKQVPDPSKVYQGAWREKENVVLDASEHIPHKFEAKVAARSRNQRAIYDLGKGAEVSTTPGEHKAGAHRARVFKDVVTPAWDREGGSHRAFGDHATNNPRFA